MVVIHARGRVFENENWPPRRARRTCISATLHEFELVFENIQKISFVFLHFCHPATVFDYAHSGISLL